MTHVSMIGMADYKESKWSRAFAARERDAAQLQKKTTQTKKPKERIYPEFKASF